MGVLYLEKVHEHRKNGDGKSRKACSYLHEKSDYAIHIRNLK